MRRNRGGRGGFICRLCGALGSGHRHPVNTFERSARHRYLRSGILVSFAHAICFLELWGAKKNMKVEFLGFGFCKGEVVVQGQREHRSVVVCLEGQLGMK